MGSALWAGISGLNASSKEMDVIGNNIANVNTIGYKAGKIYFSDVLSQSISGGSSGSMQVGRGVAVTEIATQFGAGSFETTSSATDVSIDGDGFFMVNDSDGATYYTRAGAFHLDNEGYLVDTNGYKVQGYNFSGGVSTTIEDISLQNVQSSPEVTTTFSLGVNLNAETDAGGTFNSSQTVYDSLGAKHTLNVAFTKTEANGYWGCQTSLDATDASSQTYSGLKFDSDGNLDKVYTATASKVATHISATGTLSDVVINQPDELTTNSTAAIILTWNDGAGTWAITQNGGFAGMTVAGTAASAAVDLDGAGGADLTFSGAWADTETLTFQIANAPTIDRVGQVYQDTTAAHPITLTRGASAALWTVDDAGGYTNAAVVSADADSVTLDLDGAGGADITVALSGAYVSGDQLAFTLDQTEADPVDLSITFATLPNGATIGSANVVAWNLTGSDALEITNYASTSAIKSLSNDGYASGLLKTLSIDGTGTINGFFTNGQTSDIAQLVLADFGNPWGLKKMGSNLFGETVTSGAAIKNVPGASGMGEVKSNSLEMSNTDVATEFINMITAQKAYQASARVITTEDQIMSELMNIKR